MSVDSPLQKDSRNDMEPASKRARLDSSHDDGDASSSRSTMDAAQSVTRSDLSSTTRQSPGKSPAKVHSPAYRLRYSLTGHRKPPTSVAFSSDGMWLASSSADSAIHVHSLESQCLYRVLDGHTAGVSHVAFSPSSAYLASASEDRTVRIWEIKGRREDSYAGERSARILRGHLSAVYCIAWNPGGNLLATGGMDETVRVWDVQKGECLKVLPAHSDPVSAVDFNRDGTVIVSCSWDAHIRLWDTSTGQCLKTLVDADNTPFSHVHFTPNSKFLFASTLNSTLRLWDHHTDKTLKTYSGHINRKYCIPSALDITGQYVAAGSEDGKVFIWDLQTREVVQILCEHKDAVISVAFHPYKRIFASAGLDKDSSIKIWSEDGEDGDVTG